MAEKTFDASVDQLDEVLAFVNGQLDALDCPPKIQIQIEVAVEELFVNIACYAYSPDETGDVLVRMSVSGDPAAAEISFFDRGTPYDPLSHSDPDVTLSLDEREPGGLGLLLVKKLMDEVRYCYHDGGNEIVIKKFL